MKKGYKVNGVEMVITEAVAEQFRDNGATVESVKPKINKTRTRFEIAVAPTMKAGFNYLVSLSGNTALTDLSNSTSVSASKKEIYALIEDQVENGAIEFSEPQIFFMERGTGGVILFGMKLVLTAENAFGWVESFISDSVVYPVEEVEDEEDVEEKDEDVDEVEEDEVPNAADDAAKDIAAEED